MRKLLEPKRDATGELPSAFIESLSGRIKEVVADAVEGNVSPFDESLDVVRPEWNRSQTLCERVESSEVLGTKEAGFLA
jgi:hypothetical protein